jgi:hypothetical protein
MNSHDRKNENVGCGTSIEPHVTLLLLCALWSGTFQPHLHVVNLTASVWENKCQYTANIYVNLCLTFCLRYDHVCLTLSVKFQTEWRVITQFAIYNTRLNPLRPSGNYMNHLL